MEGILQRPNGEYYDAHDWGGYYDEESVQAAQDRLEERIQEAEELFADVVTMFNDFLDLPDPGHFSDPIAGMRATMSALSTEGVDDPVGGSFYPANVELHGMTNAGSVLENWDGQAAKAFVNNMVVPF